ncbi:MAG: AgmX/PglI C-terminal domain-containing protein [Deltaproteobacteria bacterium]|nr:AgmX/PglI C-terminal domain-containing protein [Deltaproteobacteria bacterium]
MSGRPSKQEPGVLQVFIFQDGRFWGSECFAQGQLVMGRSPDVDLQLDDDITSRSHASVTVEAEGLVLEDLGSSNGTFVNGEPIERCYLDSRDEVAVGSFTLKFKVISKRKPRRQTFQDSTRVAEAPVQEEDHTEVVPAPVSDEAEEEIYDHTMRVSVPEPARASDKADERRQEIAAALREELGFETDTQRMDGLAERMEDRDRHDPADDLVTHVQPAPEYDSEPVRREEPPMPPVSEIEEVFEAPTSPQKSPVVAFEPEPDPIRPSQEMDSSPQPDFEPPSDWGAASEQPMPSGGGAAQEEDYDDEEEEEAANFVEPFSLLNNLIRENFAEPHVATEAQPVVEVIAYTSGKSVSSYEQVLQGKKHRIGPNKMPLVSFKGKGSCQVMFTDSFSGGVIVGGQTLPLDDLKKAENHAGRHKGQRVYEYKLMKGDYANLIHEGGGSFVRFVHPPKIPKAKIDFSLDKSSLKIFGSTFAGHVLLLVIMGLFSSQKQAAADVDLDRFAKVDIKELNMEKPEEEVEIPLDQLPKPEEEKVEEKKEEEKKVEEKKEEKPKPTKKPKRNKRSKKKKGGDGGSGGGVGMMAALGNLSQKKNSANIVAAVTNLDAVRVPGGRSRYKVSGLVAKLPSSSVVMSSGRGVGVKGGVEMLRGGRGRGGRAGIGPGGLGGGSSGKRSVRGVVFKSRRIKRKGHGSLSRAAIAKVVRKHLRQIQACYEKNLLLNPKLKGKLMMEWVISTSGSVSVVKAKVNTMATPAVAMCVQARIKRWKFPKPKGGTVVVTYPFIFNAVGF